MDYKKHALSALLLSSAIAHSAVDNQLIQNKAAEAIALSGGVGEVALFSIQADEDSDAEIFATASSQIDKGNDHWVILDLVGGNYEIVKTGSLEPSTTTYLSAHQLSYSEILIGHKAGLISRISFTDDPFSTDHILIEEQIFLSDLNHSLASDIDLNTNINAIVSLQGTDLNDYTVICSDDYLHVLNGTDLTSSIASGGYCQTGNIDYEEIAVGVYNEELVLEGGQYFNFDGTAWQEKTSLASSVFGSSFKVANIDDDDAQEILSQEAASQLQSFSPSGLGSWVYFSGIQYATSSFNTIDIDGDGISEIVFDYIHTADEPHESKVMLIKWDDANDTHTIEADVTGNHLTHTKVNYLPKQINLDVPSDYSLFVSNLSKANPGDGLFNQLSPNTLAQEWSGLLATGARSFDALTKTQATNNIEDYSIAQLEQVSLGDDNYEFAFKFINAETLAQVSFLVPDYNNDEVTLIDSFSSFDFDEDGIDELHAGGIATYAANAGLLLSSNLDGTDHNRLDTPTIDSVTAFHIGDVNLQNGNDIIATGKNNSGDGGISIHTNLDSVSSTVEWFAPGSGDTDFKSLISSNIKGSIEPEILGLHSQLASINPNAGADDSRIYNLSNLDLAQFTPITLTNRDYDYALATDAAGNLLLIEPKDFDILASFNACEEEVSSLATVEINNGIDIAMGICGKELKSWVVEYDLNIVDYGYSLFELASYTLGEEGSKPTLLKSITTDDAVTHLFSLSKSLLTRFELNTALGEDPDLDDYPNYKDSFPNEVTQWNDADLDNFGDNQAGVNPDPSLNDIDNDGVIDSLDPDNNPENDFDSSNDIDHGSPTFDTALVNSSFSANAIETLISLATPSASDIYDIANGNGPVTLTANANAIALTENGPNFEAALESGLYSVNWTATDTSGNSTTESHQLSVYPMIQFDTASSGLGETQTSDIKVKLSGESPEYPVTMDILITLGTASNSDLNIDTDLNITLEFDNGELEKTVQITAIDELAEEAGETFTLALVDNFAADKWTLDASASNHQVTITDANKAPTVSTATYQNSILTDSPTVIDGVITIDASITDPNAGDTHTYLWDLSSLGLTNSLLEDVQINPTAILPGSYSISLTVTDDGAPNLVTQQSILLMIDYGDSDGDGYKDNVDAFPDSITEWSDRDGDGYSDQVGDAFPDNGSEFEDTDGDGVGNNADPFDDDATETQDSDGDGVGDNSDIFPNDKTETVDSDGDGVGDNADAFNTDPNESQDTDGDGVGDNADAFPNDATETVDTDGDGVGDNSDEFPGDARTSNEVEEESVSAGSLNLLYILLALSLIFIRRKTI